MKVLANSVGSEKERNRDFYKKKLTPGYFL